MTSIDWNFGVLGRIVFLRRFSNSVVRKAMRTFTGVFSLGLGASYKVPRITF